MSYDTKCYELAKSFAYDLPAGPTTAEREAITRELAQVIQTAIEDYLQGWEAICHG